MLPSRREALFFAAAVGVTAALGLQVQAGFLRGKFVVRCSDGHDDTVDGITSNHDCEHKDASGHECGKKSVDDGKANVVCPKLHATEVSDITESHKCSYKYEKDTPDDGKKAGEVCGLECRR
jgi:hypothetical protein